MRDLSTTLVCTQCQTAVSEMDGFCPACRAPAPAAIYRHATPALQGLFDAVAQLLRDGRADDAVQACRARHHEHPAIAGPLVVLGDLYRAGGQYAEAIAAYKQAIERDPPYLAILQQKLDDTIDRLRDSRPSAEPAPAVTLIAAPAPPRAPQAVPEDEANVLDGAVHIAGLPTQPAARPPLEEAEEEVSPLTAWLTPRRALLVFAGCAVVLALALLFHAQPWKQPYRPPPRVVPIPLNADDPPNMLDPYTHGTDTGTAPKGH